LDRQSFLFRWQGYWSIFIPLIVRKTLDYTPVDAAKQIGMTKPMAVVISVLAGAVVLSPIAQNWREKPRDSFPLSYFPMFSFEQRTEGQVTHFVGYDAKGNRVPIPSYYGGVGGMNQIRKQINKAVRGGHARGICELAARRIVQRNDPRFAQVERVELVTSVHRLNDYFSGKNKQPRLQRVHAWAFVERK